MGTLPATIVLQDVGSYVGEAFRQAAKRTGRQDLPSFSRRISAVFPRHTTRFALTSWSPA